MLLGGLWHGASWNFVFWGGLHGIYLAIERMMFSSKLNPHPWTSPFAWARSFFVFCLITLTWIPFRSPDLQTTILILRKLFFIKIGYSIEWYFVGALIALPVVIIGGWLIRRFEWHWPIFPIQKSYTLAFMMFEILIVFFFAPLNTSPFIYFQF